MEIQPKLDSLSNILNGKLFEIPTFQRPYSWKSDQRKDLFYDIDKVLKSPKEIHFMSTLVCLKGGSRAVGSEEIERMQIVDGQQRLTTLIVLLKAIQIELAKRESKKEKKEAESLQKILVREKSLVLLQTNHQSRNILRDYLVRSAIPDVDKQKTVAEKELAIAIKDCCQYVNEKEDLVKLLKVVKNNLKFIIYTIDDEKIVYTVFEVLNSRGLPVSVLDKCKNMMMGCVHEKYQARVRKELISSMHAEWQNIYSAIGNRTLNDSELLRFSATLCKPSTESVGKTLSEDESLRLFKDISMGEIKDNLPDQLNDNNEEICVLIAKFIKSVANSLCNFAKDVHKSNNVTNITQARLLAVSIDLSCYTEEQKEELMTLWEKTTFKIYGLFGKDSRNSVGDYVRLARRIISGECFDTTKSELERICSEYLIENAIKELSGKPWYLEYKDEAKFVLYRYEEYLAKKDGVKISDNTWNEIWSDTAATTIEHIYPKTYTDDLQRNWPSDDINCQEKLDEFVHNIGNLLLLPPGINSSIGQKPFSEKKEKYKNYSMRIAKAVTSKETWSKKDVLDREEEILNFIKDKWG